MPSVSSFAQEVSICGAHEYQGGSAELDYENIYMLLRISRLEQSRETNKMK
jgi:hypothetical protein